MVQAHGDVRLVNALVKRTGVYRIRESGRSLAGKIGEIFSEC
jgi:hypothetical protein